MNRLGLHERAKILGMLVEGNSMRAASRMADVSINTVTKLLIDVGTAAAAYQHVHLRDLPCKRLQLDEIWSFCYAKEKNVAPVARGYGIGDVWTWTALCADTKLVPSFLVGRRDAFYARKFTDDLASRLLSRVQVTTDGHKGYLQAVPGAFGFDVDYAMLVKTYGEPRDEAHRYSPAECTGAVKTPIIGEPDLQHVSTSYVERQNLTMRMSMRRFTRLTNGFSKKIENLEHAVALHFMHYNFGRVHKALRITPAMAAGVSDHVWTLEEIASIAN